MRVERDEESETDAQDDGAHPHELAEVACAVDDYAAEDAGTCAGDDKGEEDEAGFQGCSFEYGLKEERHVVFCANEDLWVISGAKARWHELRTYKSMKEGHEERCDVALIPKQLHRDKRISRHAGLAINEGEDHDASHDEQRDDFCRIPGEDCAAKIETEKHHERKSEKGKDADPIHGLDALSEGRMLVFDIKEEQD